MAEGTAFDGPTVKLQSLQELVDGILQQQQAQAAPVVAGGAAAPSSAGANAEDCSTGLPLPVGLLHQVIRRCNSRAAAAAAVSCKQLHEVVAAQRFLQVPAAVQLLLRCVKTVGILNTRSELSDGWAEAHFAAKFPLDGSAAVGIDLVSLTRVFDQV
jgi:hypothetical protein